MPRLKHLGAGLAGLGLAITGSLLAAEPGAAAAKPVAPAAVGPAQPSASSPGGKITRSEVLSRARNWLNNHNITYSQSGTYPDAQGRQYRRDCSGFVDMAEHMSDQPNTESMTGGGYLRSINRSDLKPGDAIGILGPGTGGDAGHVMLFVKWNDSAHKGLTVYQQNGDTSANYPHQSSYSSWPTDSRGEYKPYRYKNIVDDAPSTSGNSGWAAYANGAFHLVRPGAGGHAYQTRAPLPGPWTSWENLDGTITGTPAIINSGHRYDVFAESPTGTIEHKIFDNNKWTTWGPTKSTTGTTITALKNTGVSATYYQQHQRFFYISPTGKYSQAYYNKGWNVQNLQTGSTYTGTFTGTPAAIAIDNRLYLFGLAPNGQILERDWNNGKWTTDWYHTKTTNNNYLTAKKDTGIAAVYGLGHARLIYTSPTGHTEQSWYNNGWHSQNLGGTITGTPATVLPYPTRLDIYATSPNGDIYQNYYTQNNHWRGWKKQTTHP